MSQVPLFDVAVVGAGPAGLTAAVALAAMGVEVALAAPAYDEHQSEADRRTTLLLAPSVELLRNLAVWELCAGKSEPLVGIRIADDRGGLIRAPEILFRAEELGLTSFGANIPNPALNAALNTVAARAPRLTRLDAATAVAPDADTVRLHVAGTGWVKARLAVAADGRNSITRTAAGIPTRTWTYPQTAIATSFRHARPHAGVSIELHRRSGPLTTVPLPDSASSLVWVEEPAEARRLASVPEAEFTQALDECLQGTLGAISGLTPRAVYPLSGLRAERMTGARVALIGEAAHVMPPIGAQGLNLSMRDAALLAEFVAEAHVRREDVGGPATLAAYDRARTADVLTRTLSVDLLNRSLLTEFLALEALRGLSLHLLAALAPLRRLVMQTGLAAAGPLPRLMQPGCRLAHWEFPPSTQNHQSARLAGSH